MQAVMVLAHLIESRGCITALAAHALLIHISLVDVEEIREARVVTYAVARSNHILICNES